MNVQRLLAIVIFCSVAAPAIPAAALEPIPEKLLVLTFDDSCKSHFTVARPILKEYGFGATFFVTEGLTYRKNPAAYMTWQEIKTLHDDGFEIGNHLKDHMGVNSKNVVDLKEQLEGIDQRCAEHGIPKTVSFGWPANFVLREALPILKQHGIVWGRRGNWPERPPNHTHPFGYDPHADHALLIPCTSISGPGYTLEDFKSDLATPKKGEIAVACFHGVPETEHPWVNTPRELFEEMMLYLRDNDFKVIAVRDLKRYVDPNDAPGDPWKIIDERRAALADKE